MRAYTAVLLSTVALCTLTSCLTNQTAVLPPVPAVEAHVITGQATIRRTIASTTDESLLDAEFQQVLNAEDPSVGVKEQVDRVGRIFYRAQALLNDYDAKLDSASKDVNAKGVDLQQDDTYARLISIWMMREESLSKIRYFYTRGLEIETAREDDSKLAHQLQAQAAHIHQAFRESLLSAPNSTGRLAKQDLVQDLIQVNLAFHDYQMKHDNQAPDITKRMDGFNTLLQNEVIEDASETQKFYERNDAQLRRESENARNDKEINAEIERLLPDVKKHLAEQFEDRAPQSAGSVVAGLGRHGMMNGNEFAPGVWALTFDDGPHPTYTMKDLANLKASGIKATFFWLAQNVSRMPTIVHNVKDAGMTLANHSYTHPQLTKLGPAGWAHEIDDSTAVDVAVYGFKPKFFRCPYGACGSQTSSVRQKIADQGMVSVTWNVDSLDWQDKNPSSIYTRVKKQMAVQKHGIILFHDIHPQSVVASKMVMDDFVAGQKTGQYRTVTIQQAFDELNRPEGMK